VLASTLRLLGYSILGFTDPSPESSSLSGIEYLGDDQALEDYSEDEIQCVVGLGSTRDTSRRAKLFKLHRLKGFSFPMIIHPSASVAQEAELSTGLQIMAGAVVQTGAVIDENVIVNTSASIDHDCHIGKHVHVAPGATLSGNVAVGEGSHIGAGAVVIQGVQIGVKAIVGAGAVVVKDVPSNTVVMGVPARERD
jgi:UDP-perosamine 4-acetyltransferase